jgi:hypothetical protein
MRKWREYARSDWRHFDSVFTPATWQLHWMSSISHTLPKSDCASDPISTSSMTYTTHQAQLQLHSYSYSHSYCIVIIATITDGTELYLV